MKKTLADKIIAFNNSLHFSGTLPKGFQVLNPFRDNKETIPSMEKFYRKFYNDTTPRRFIIGINPSRHGAGVTGVPFTDTKRLESECGITMHSVKTHEVSSVFFYEMITAFGGVEKFYSQFYINSPFALAIVRETKPGVFLNANYYDDNALFLCVKDYMIETLKRHTAVGLITKEVFVLGKKNAGFIQKLNNESSFFDKITVLEHPRYIQQYKSKEKQYYIDKYLAAFA
ncbi:MAG TPA: SMUG2 DNA glycosylase family protein [Turneriella sp.]|nr:SMUG2 DNA glycosylase family protein [Turneriella sp.]